MPGNFTFFTTRIENGSAFFDENETQHALVSLRHRRGDEIVFTDGRGALFTGVIKRTEKRFFEAEIIATKTDGNPPTLTIVCGIIKSSDRLEWMVEKATELGVAAIRFVKCTNSERSRINLEKLNKTAIAALKQSHGCWLPLVDEISWETAMQLPGNKMIAAISNSAKPLRGRKTADVCLIGPEGDFTALELDQALIAGYEEFTMGERILRTETAVVSIAAFFALK
jgi:16S rRNA (uracil1498-N3)-methyltransferase